MAISSWRWYPVAVVWLVFVFVSVALFRNHADVFTPTSDTAQLGISFNPQPVLLYVIALGALVMLSVWWARRR